MPGASGDIDCDAVWLASVEPNIVADALPRWLELCEADTAGDRDADAVPLGDRV